MITSSATVRMTPIISIRPIGIVSIPIPVAIRMYIRFDNNVIGFVFNNNGALTDDVCTINYGTGYSSPDQQFCGCV